MQPVLGLIEAASAEFGAHAEELFDKRGVFSLPLTLADGSVLQYKLEVLLNDRGVSVRELVPSQLPSFCPQRHINIDGTFCLYWSESGGLEISDAEGATRWWETVWKYLTLQARAERQRRWPNNEEWAHGSAALYQKRAIDAAARLGPIFVDALNDAAIQVRPAPKRVNSQGPTLQVFVRGRHLYSVWLASGKVVNRKQRCFCGVAGLRKPAKLRSCKRHAEDASELARNIRDWVDTDEAFWKIFTSADCCGSCDNCPLQEKNEGK